MRKKRKEALPESGAAEMTSSRSDEMKAAVGFNPRFADEHASAVAERRLNDGFLSNFSSVATRRPTACALVVRGFKPAATISASLCEAGDCG